jgi:ribonuclease HI
VDAWINGSCASAGSGVGVVLISLGGEVEPMAFKLEFGNTKNTAEYEALLLGITSAKERGVKILKAWGDAELIVKQVKGQYSVKNHKLKNYRNRVLDEIESFEAFSIEEVPREMNSKADSLAVSASLLLPHPDFKDKKYQIEIVYRPVVPDNTESWQVFNDDKSLQLFLENDEFSFEHESGGSNEENSSINAEPDQNEEVQLKSNIIPPYFVALEKLFNRHDAYIKQKRIEKGPTTGEYKGVNIGEIHDPKMINLGKCCTPKEKEVAKQLFEEYKDVFVWSYEDLKTYRDGKVKHQIPLKPDAVLFRQKQRNYNPKVAYAIFREVDKMLKARIIYPIHHST